MTNAENTINLAEHRQHRRARLLRVAAGVFDDVGLDDFTLATIRDRGQVTDRVLAREFGSLPGLCRALASHHAAERLRTFTDIVSTFNAGHTDGLTAPVHALFTLPCDTRDRLLLVHDTRLDLLRLDPDAVREHEHAYTDHIEAALTLLVTAHMLPARVATPTNAELVSLLWENTLLCSALAGATGDALRADSAAEVLRFLELASSATP